MARGSLSLLLALAITACNGGSQAPNGPSLPPDADVEIGETIATVSGFPIGAREFEKAASRVSPANGEAYTDEEKRQILDELVTEKMLYLQARALGVDRNPKVQQVMVNTLLREQVYSEVRSQDISEEELQAYFDEHSDEFVVPEKMQVLRIFIRSGRDRTPEEAAQLASELHAQVATVAADMSGAADPVAAKGAVIDRFKALASEHSEDPYRRRGGDLGFMSREGKPGIDTAVPAKAFELGDGVLSEPFEAGGGYNIVFTQARRDQVSRTFAQMKGSVLRKVKAQRYRELFDGYVAGIESTYSVDVDESALSALSPRPMRRSGPGGIRPGVMSLPGADDDDDDNDGMGADDDE